MRSGIYQITNQVNGKRYVGSSMNLKRRWREHLCHLRGQRHHNRYLQRAFDKYGEAAFVFSVLKHIEDSSQLIKCEQDYLDTGSFEYNFGSAAQSPMLGRRHSENARAKMSMARKGKTFSKEHCRKISQALSGERNGMYGKHLKEEHRRRISEALKNPSPERRRKMSEAQKGSHHTEETRRKMSEAQRGERNHMYGKHLSEEHKQKLSKALAGRILSEETKGKISNALKGKPFTEEHARNMGLARRGEGNPNYGKLLNEETRRKISASKLGKHPSIETRAKMSIAQKARWRRVREAGPAG